MMNKNIPNKNFQMDSFDTSNDHMNFRRLLETDYCKPTLCGESTKHIGCDHSGDFDPNCPADKSLLTLSKKDISQIVDAHNRMRNYVASGKQKGLKPASKMLTMVRNLKK